MTVEIRKVFEAIGARAHVETHGNVFEIDVLQNGDREVYQLRYPRGDVITAEALDVKPKQRHLVLDVFGWRMPVSGRYLCGHDEFHWFVAQLPFEDATTTVRGAMEALKPVAVLREQRRKGVKRRLYRRKTAAYVRQGEWFFLPKPKLSVDERLVARDGRLARQGGKPHHVEWLYRVPGGGQVFARGAVSHSDHATIVLQQWHLVLQNEEAKPAPEARPVTRMMYMD